jgi:digeranylgeranylglycerophospholipid reductase
MTEYDVIVVGAGPAGSAAAKEIAAQGLKTLMLEEHTSVGDPDHCWGLLPMVSRPELTEEILRSMPQSIVLREYSAMRVFTPGGKIAKEVSVKGKSDYLVRRNEFDKQLAIQAANAGADLRLNTRVTGLIKKGDRVVGVTTSSTHMPELYAKLVIGADGISASNKGTPKWGGLSRTDRAFINGVTLELTNVRDIELDVYEWHTGTFSKRGWVGICPRDKFSCTTDFLSMAEFEQVKKGDYLVSKKFRDAVPVRMTGWSHPADMGIGLPKVVENGLMLIGSAANLIGIVPGIVSGRYAAEVAIEAVRQGDVTIKNLSKYEELYKNLKAPLGFMDAPPLYKCSSDEEIEKVLMELVEKDELPFTVPIPL